MKIHLGTDICEISRIKSALEKYQRRFINKIFTEAEIEYCESSKNRVASYTARFAAKEAISKALGTGINGPGWSAGIDFKEAELIRTESGKVEVKLHDKAQVAADNLGITQWSISISHGKEYATATVIGHE